MKFNINSGVIYSWIKKYLNLDYNGLKRKIGRPCKMNLNKKLKEKETTTDKDKKIKELEERNAQLEMENDLLKKLRALVQQRKEQQKKKK
ncbi:hypothetical protein DMC14_002535 [Metamycoplasma phocicerebrale]|uniref:Transposase n=1 Tax=Metamycoplasma phocicerebrale TaxID=142649 RepID=A0A3D8Y1M3_9BACT|nr:hypothetical protein [Metamycoplasma phocicerebrale]AZZ65393.1 hypothetical protein DMC14_001120 [Metamycoplasma phocicerebrale]AZZ65634.1 hypothetical protein DMC14_002465 [Metamycoplasma phocicerebrale]AZZ65642.1 hypothetical protein DMC14_002505 [Metamycoplasma phocicerebrale]AZZ65647.1 hypothetical protein DMC14_002535 [Metamycoplasma phocicerebrale]